MFVVYHPGYTVDIGPSHRFPMQKYRLVYERLLAEGTLAQAHVIQPDLAAMADLLLVHRRDYVDRFLTGEMSPKEMRLLGFPWSEPLARRARLATQGTLTASLLAWHHGLASNLAGGSHHAFADHGEGFSVFNTSLWPFACCATTGYNAPPSLIATCTRAMAPRPFCY